MKFAFSTIACPKWNLETTAARAREYGYDGVEIRGFLNEPVLAENVFACEAARIKAGFVEHGVQIACLSSGISITGNPRKDLALAENARRFIDTAAALGCGLVRVRDTQIKPRQGRAAAGAALAQWLSPLADYATQRNVTVLVENALSFRTAREMWLILEQACHPSIGCCWDVASAALAGESPAISVPVLNSRIQYVQLRDLNLTPAGATVCKLGQGDVRIDKLLIRLRGIGYAGWTSLHWDKTRLSALAEPEEVLPEAIAKLREWTKPQVLEKAPPPAKAPKPAKVPAPAVSSGG